MCCLIRLLWIAIIRLLWIAIISIYRNIIKFSRLKRYITENSYILIHEVR